MQHPYFCKTKDDAAYFERYLKGRLPSKILDMHSHMNLPEHVEKVSEARINSDWALQAGFKMTADEAKYFSGQLFPHVAYSFVGFAFPIKEVDLPANNKYISKCIADRKIEAGLMVITPDMPIAEMTKQITAGNFSGIKPYPDLVGAQKGAQIRIYDFVTRKQIEAVWKMDKCILLHLPRADRLADEENVKELREIVNDFPGIKLIVAHLGRCYNSWYWERAADRLGADLHKLWFDTAGVMNPDVLFSAFSKLNPKKLMFGLDLPIFLWHGTRKWTQKSYCNLCRENLPWKKDMDSPERQSEYTFFVYEQMHNLLDAMDQCRWSAEQEADFFYGNAMKLLVR